MRGSRVLGAAGALAVAAAGFWAAAAVSAGGTIHDFVGAYQGFYFDQVDGQNGPFTFTMTEVENNQADATLVAGPETTPFHVTMGASNVFTAVGTGPLGFVAHGTATQFGDGSSLERSRYTLRDRSAGALEKGTLLFLQSFPDAGAAQLPSALTGSFVRDDGQTGDISVELAQQGSQFQGTGSFDGLDFPFVGTIGAPAVGPSGAPGIAPVHAISVSSVASIVIGGTWTAAPQPHMVGTVEITFADGSVHTATFTLAGSPTAGG